MDFLMSMRRLVSFSFVLESFDVYLTYMLDSQSPPYCEIIELKPILIT